MKHLLVCALLALGPRARALTILLGDSLAPGRPVILYMDGHAYRYPDTELTKALLLLFDLTQRARARSYEQPEAAAGLGRQFVPSRDEARLRHLRLLTRQLARAKKLSREVPPAPTQAQLIAYLNAEATAILAHPLSAEGRTLEGRTYTPSPNADPLSLLLSFYSLDWPVSRRVREELTLR